MVGTSTVYNTDGTNVTSSVVMEQYFDINEDDLITAISNSSIDQ
jgi:hypothetical protein